MSRSILEAARKQADNYKKFGKQARAELSQDEQAGVCVRLVELDEANLKFAERQQKLVSQVEEFRKQIDVLNGRIGGLTKKLNAAK